MVATRYTILGALAFLILAAGVIVVRASYNAQRTTCNATMRMLSLCLDDYTKQHHGQLPRNPDELDDASRYAPIKITPVDGRFPYEIAKQPLKWKQGKPQPYLWDFRPHRFVNGIHVLYTDGTVRLQETIPPQ